jgi:prepilin-type N-terminal cleavage/methylation domain-containing protein
MGARRGFTLIELIAVMAIIAIMMVSIVPALDNMLPSYRLSAGARHVASNIELCQSEAIGQRKEFVVAYNLDDHTYWIVLPQRAGEERNPEDDDKAPEGEEAKAEEAGKFQRPENDLEHGKAPPKATSELTEEEKAEQEEALPEFVERDKLDPTHLPDDIEFSEIIVDGESETSGTVYVSFDHRATSGNHIVGLRLTPDRATGEDRSQVWVLFNPMTRTIEYHDEKPSLPTLSPDGGRGG